ncbi:DUF21 domain-containing protein [bacterium]|nr:DUF21 domain-containing protein [bacterium]
MSDFLIILFGLFAAAFFSGTETAFISRLYRSESGLSEWWRRRPERILSTTLVGTNLAIVIASAVATERAVEWFGTAGELYITIILSVFILIFCETIPKSAALRWSERWTKLSAVPLAIFHWAAIAVIAITTTFSRIITAIFEKMGTPDYPQPMEMIEVIRKPFAGLDEGRVTILMVFLRFADRRVMDIMISSNKIQRVSVGEFFKVAHRKIGGGSPYVIVEDDGKPVGVVDAALVGSVKFDDKITIDKISTIFVPEVKDAMEYLREASELNFPPALVIDEHGVVSGAVGGEPMMAKIVRTKGLSSQRVLQFPETSIIIPADMPVEKFELISGIAIPKGSYQTIGGFVLEIAHRIPGVNEVIDWEQIRFRIVSADRRHIERLEVMRIC